MTDFSHKSFRCSAKRAAIDYQIGINQHALSAICSLAMFLLNAHAHTQSVIFTQLLAGKLTNQN